MRRFVCVLAVLLLGASVGCGSGTEGDWTRDYDAFVNHLASRLSTLGENPAMDEIRSEFKGTKVEWSLVLESSRPDGGELEVRFRDTQREADPPCRIRAEFYADAADAQVWRSKPAGETVAFTGTIDSVMVATLTSTETGESRPGASIIVTGIRPAE